MYFNYCDSWCDRCAFTSRCRVFADAREMEAAHDPNLQPVVTAPEHPMDTPPPPPPWLQELLEEMDEASRNPIPDETCISRVLREVPERDAIDGRAEAYSRRVRAWFDTHTFEQSPDAGDPRDVIAWFHFMIHVKAMRALHGLAEDDPSERDFPPDHDGSAKVALLGIDRSLMAWRDLADVGIASACDVAPFIEDLEWLRAALERTFPKARAFMRPGFDEPDDVARLLRRAD